MTRAAARSHDGVPRTKNKVGNHNVNDQVQITPQVAGATDGLSAIEHPPAEYDVSYLLVRFTL
jgi:hypothetical protein